MIQPPGWAKNAIPKHTGWHDPRTDELLKSQRMTTDQINEYMGITSEPQMLTEVPDTTGHGPADPLLHTHDDGTEHSHDGGDMPHEHDDLDSMTKLELEALGREHGIELDRRKTKADLVVQLREHMLG